MVGPNGWRGGHIDTWSFVLEAAFGRRKEPFSSSTHGILKTHSPFFSIFILLFAYNFVNVISKKHYHNHFFCHIELLLIWYIYIYIIQNLYICFIKSKLIKWYPDLCPIKICQPSQWQSKGSDGLCHLYWLFLTTMTFSIILIYTSTGFF